MKNKKIITAALSAIVLGTVLMSSSVFANVDRWGYKFDIPAYKSNGRIDEPRYRSTTKPDTPWDVCLEGSGEGNMTYTNFWLEVYNGDNVSTWRSVQQGAGVYRTAAYSDANQKNVYLTAENNNNNASIYTVQGYWDEEE